MSEDQIINIGKKVISIEAKAVGGLTGSIDKNFVKAVNIIYESKGRVVFTGLGKSGLIARKIVATMNSTGTPAIFLHPTDALHGDLGMVRKDDCVIIISKSGNTDELLDLVLMLKRMEVKIIGMLGITRSKIGKMSDVVLDVSVEEEACPHDLAPTASTNSSVSNG